MQTCRRRGWLLALGVCLAGPTPVAAGEPIVAKLFQDLAQGLLLSRTAPTPSAQVLGAVKGLTDGLRLQLAEGGPDWLRRGELAWGASEEAGGWLATRCAPAIYAEAGTTLLLEGSFASAGSSAATGMGLTLRQLSSDSRILVGGSLYLERHQGGGGRVLLGGELRTAGLDASALLYQPASLGDPHAPEQEAKGYDLLLRLKLPYVSAATVFAERSERSGPDAAARDVANRVGFRFSAQNSLELSAEAGLNERAEPEYAIHLKLRASFGGPAERGPAAWLDREPFQPRDLKPYELALMRRDRPARPLGLFVY